MNIIILFSVLSLVNVIFSTVRSITTIRCGKFVASIVSAGYFSFYNIMIIITVADFDLWIKCAVTFGANLLGVFIVKLIEEKMEKDKLWIFMATAKVSDNAIIDVAEKLKELDIKLVYTTVIENELYTLQIFSNSKEESNMITAILENYGIKYSAVETKKCQGV